MQKKNFFISAMKFLISFVALAIVAVSVDAAFDDETKFPEMATINKIGAIQKSIGNINLAATDLNTMETNLEPLTEDVNKVTVETAETAVKLAVNKDDIANNWVTPKSTGA